jgi:hypothetical protein
MSHDTLSPNVKEIIKRLLIIIKAAEKSTLTEEEFLILRNSILPAIFHCLTGDLQFLGIQAYGDGVVIQDWISSDGAPLFEYAGRFHQLSNMLGSMGVQNEIEELEQGVPNEQCDDDEQCDCKDPEVN